jgi:hypothetical protein
MKRTCQIVSGLAFAGILVLPVVFLAGGMSLPALKIWLLALTVAWFASVPFWMERRT